jgi:hypothetical protein
MLAVFRFCKKNPQQANLTAKSKNGNTSAAAKYQSPPMQ